eukprot:CAMPEP_0206304306 /NCGR_PEP_ID=MMETSP0106_2-20121207/9682_1 /ASSEMBLY_ACC=CAM_ASM_000206 /TAXON_ID=81532 /ORGANISM="Acanthoeca-like sp., Strain 10tr" /LENGTH=105 /DNA_ID=CAMNT_0053735123 /DNA_START=221 /DNA_END=535 /DNA_ORIENTATION=-
MSADGSAVLPAAALHLLRKYAANLARDPTNPKFRRVRVLNPKFHKDVWSDLPSRTLLVEAGFELDEASADGPCVSLPAAADADLFINAVDVADGIRQARESALAV